MIVKAAGNFRRFRFFYIYSFHLSLSPFLPIFSSLWNGVPGQAVGGEAPARWHGAADGRDRGEPEPAVAHGKRRRRFPCCPPGYSRASMRGGAAKRCPGAAYPCCVTWQAAGSRCEALVSDSPSRIAGPVSWLCLFTVPVRLGLGWQVTRGLVFLKCHVFRVLLTCLKDYSCLN